MYLWRRGHHFWFRKANPLDLVSVLGTEVRCSLHTEQHAVARRRAWALLVALEQVYEILSSERPLEPARSLLGAFVDDFRQNAAGTPEGHFRASAGLQTAAIRLGVPALPLPSGGSQTLVPIDDVVPVLMDEEPRAPANAVAAELLRLAIAIRQEKGWSRPGRARALIALCQKLTVASDVTPLDTPRGLDAVRAIIREEVSRLGEAGTVINQGPQFDPDKLREIVAGEVRAGVAAAGRERWSDESLSVMIDEFLVEEAKKETGSKHKADVAGRLRAFLLFVGNIPVRDVTRGHIKKYRDVLDQLPERFQLRFRTDDMRVAIQKNGQRKVPFKPIGPTTIDLKWLGPVIRLFEWLVAEEKIAKNPTVAIRSTQEDGAAANTKKLPFKTPQISALFAITSKASRATALYWLPLIMLCTGARPNELAQLRTTDLDKDFNGQPHLSVLCLLDDDDDPKPIDKAEEKRNRQRVKSPAARRMIPLHEKVLAAGFVDFVEDQHAGTPKQLFRDLEPDKHGFWSAAITKKINRVIRAKLEITDPRYSLYSLRHNFIDACKAAEIEEGVRMKWMGHQIEGPQGIYGNPLPLPHESKLINTIAFDGIDFGRYQDFVL
jgi:integrase